MDIIEARKKINEAIATNATALYLTSFNQKTKLAQDDLIKLIPDIIKLQNLKILYLYSSQITKIPKEIGELQNLVELYLFRNQINEIPKEIFQLQNLKVLQLADNQISEIPKEISQLQNLRKLVFTTNQISEIPKEISQLRNLKELYLAGNKGLEGKIPYEILEDYTNPQKILNYYFKIKEDETRPINEAKIVVIGEANVGKTCLINRLILDKVLPTTSTHGIEIRQWEDVEMNKAKVRLNVWDFGGQELMHSTHQFFFTTRTIYILVINARENEDSNKVEEWLKRVESFGGSSPVIIVGNKVDENERNVSSTEIGYFDINRRTLAGKYPNIKGFYGVCSDDTKITGKAKKQKYVKLFNEFRKDVLKEIGSLEGLSQPFPSDWYAVKESLEEMQKENIPFISYDKYIGECVEENVRDETSQKTIVEFLNEVGTVIYFKDVPDTMVFNPEWITRGVYAIVDNPGIVKNKGELEISQLNDILDRTEYPREKHKYILDIMRKFELCVDIERDRKFLIPDLLPLDEPYTGEWNNTLRFQFHYETYLKNIFTKFIVRIFPYIHQKTYWRNGVVVELEGSTALVKADALERKVYIQIQGSNIRTRQKLLGIIYNEFNQIHSGFTFRQPDEFVAHPHITVKDTDGKEKALLKDYRELIGMENKGLKEVFVKELNETLPISHWLDGVSSREERDKIKETGKFEGEPNYFHKEDYEAERQTALTAGKRNEAVVLKRKVEEAEDKIKICDEEAGRIARFRAFALLIPIAIILLGWAALIISLGWDTMEIWTYIVGIPLLILVYGIGAWRLEEYNLFNPKRIFDKEKERLYKKFKVNLRDCELNRQKLEELEHELGNRANFN